MLAWLTKSALPNSLAEYVITLPTDELWQADFFGAIAPLVDAVNWEKHETLTPDEMADKWAEILLPQFWGLKMAVPPGTVVAYAGPTAPDGWLLCDGAEYQVVDYPNLGAVLGSYYGGDGIESFVVPNMQDRFILGASGTHVRGVNGGAETHTLTIPQLPAHNHPPAPGTQAYFYQPTGGVGGTVSWVAGVTMATNAVTGNAGGGQSHNNMPPFINQPYIIKT